MRIMIITKRKEMRYMMPMKSFARTLNRFYFATVGPMRHDMGPLLPFEELMTETGVQDDFCQPVEDCDNNTLADCILPDLSALLHVTDRRKGQLRRIQGVASKIRNTGQQNLHSVVDLATEQSVCAHMSLKKQHDFCQIMGKYAVNFCLRLSMYVWMNKKYRIDIHRTMFMSSGV